MLNVPTELIKDIEIVFYNVKEPKAQKFQQVIQKNTGVNST